MSAVRQAQRDGGTVAAATQVIPGLRAVPIPGEAALRIAGRCLAPAFFHVLEVIAHHRTPPHGQPLEWREVAVQCDLLSASKDPLKQLRPYGWLLAGLLHAGERLQWAEIAAHPWICGLIAESTLYNKRKGAAIPGGGTLDAWLVKYDDALASEQQRLQQEFAQSDAKLARDIFELQLHHAKRQLQRIKPTDEQEKQLGLELEVIQGEKYAQIIDGLDREAVLGKILANNSATAERAFRNLRLVNNLDPDAPGETSTLPATAEGLAELDAQYAAELAALEAEEAQLDAELARA